MRDDVYLQECVLELPDSSAQYRNFSLLPHVPCALQGPLIFHGLLQGVVLVVEVRNESDTGLQFVIYLIGQVVQL